MKENPLEYQIVLKYKEVAMRMLQYSFTNLSLQELESALDYSIIKRMKNHELLLHNNYKNKTINSTVLDMCEYILSREPIITPYGVMFKRKGDVPNPIAKLLETFMEGRKIYKNEMKKHPKGSEEFEKYNLLQLLSKVDANGAYGAMGNMTCILYNLYVAASTTTQGRSCISAAGLQFEMFLANNVKFGSLNEVITFIDNICHKEIRKYNDKQILDRNITLDECFYQIMSTCGFHYIPSQSDLIIVWEIMNNLKQEDLNRLYYKNNLYEFMNNQSMNKAIQYMLQSLEKPFLNPNKAPDEIRPELEELCDILMEYVYYPHQIIDRLDRYRTMIRNVAIITDTDSVILSLDAWYRFILDKVKDVPMTIKKDCYSPIEYISKDEFGDKEVLSPFTYNDRPTDYDFYNDEITQLEKSFNPISIIPQEGLRYSIINIIAYCIGKLINDYMERYTMNSNSYSPESKCLLIMKNEFLFKRILLTNGMKNYASNMLLQEGNVVPEDKRLDIKGLPMTKSGTNKKTQEKLKEILYEEILNSDEIDQVGVLKELAKFEKEIFESLKSGKKDFYKPVRVRSINSYPDPMRQQAIKASIIYNLIKNDNMEPIDLEERNSLDLVKVNITPKNIQKLKDINLEVYEKLISIMNTEKVFMKGIDIIACPKNTVLPDYIIEFIDYTSLINDNLKNFPLSSVGMMVANDNINYSNIISL